MFILHKCKLARKKNYTLAEEGIEKYYYVFKITRSLTNNKAQQADDDDDNLYCTHTYKQTNERKKFTCLIATSQQQSLLTHIK